MIHLPFCGSWSWFGNVHPSCPQLQLVLSRMQGQDWPPPPSSAASSVSNQNQCSESALWGGEGRFFRAPGPGLGARMGAGLGAWPQPEPCGTGCSLSEGETEAQAALATGMGGKSESGTLSVIFLYHLFIFSHAPEALLFCKPRVFRNKRDGGSFASAEILRVPFETEPGLGARWLCCHCHLPLSACRDEAEMSPEAGRDNPALSLLGQAGCGQGGESLPQGAPGQGAGTWWGGESKTNFRASPSTLSLSASESPSPPCLQNH